MGRTAVLTFPDLYPDDEFRVVISVQLDPFFDFAERWASRSTMSEYHSQFGDFAKMARPEWTRNHPDLAVDEFGSLDFTLARGIVSGWLNAVQSVPDPLLPVSSDGGPSREAQTSKPASRSRSRRSSSGRSSTAAS